MCIENFKHKKNNSVAQKTGRNAGCFMEMKKSQKLCSLLWIENRDLATFTKDITVGRK